MTIFTGRNLSRQMWMTIPDQTVADCQEKAAYLRLVPALFLAIKQHLRHAGVDDKLKSVLSPEQCLELQYVTNMPLKVTQ